MSFQDWMDDFEVEVPEFLLPGGSLSAVNAIVSLHDQVCIGNAAHCMLNGYAADAERHRAMAGYDTPALRADRR